MTFATATTWHSTSCVTSLSRYRAPTRSGSRPIQKTFARTRFDSTGASVSCEAICPRSMKMWSLNVIPIDSPADADSVDAVAGHRSIVATRAVLL